MNRLMHRVMAPLAVAASLLLPLPAAATGDLLVAPTRVVLEGRRSAEVVLNNIGSEAATYRISLEIKRMNAAGRLENVPVEQQNAAERAMLGMVVFSPRRVVLPPNQPQVVRISVRQPEGLPDGEYRAHMLFRAIPEARAATPQPVQVQNNNVAISLTPIYGLTIPLIVRRGQLEANATLARPRIEAEAEGRQLFRIDIARTGRKSIYGEMIVTPVGATEPVVLARGVGVYPEVDQRTLSLPLAPEQVAALRGQRVNIRFIEDRDAGGATIAELNGVQM